MSAASSPYTGPVCFLRVRLGLGAATTSSSTSPSSTSTATEATAVTAAFLVRLAFLAAGVAGSSAGCSAAGCAAFALRRLAVFFPAGQRHGDRWAWANGRRGWLAMTMSCRRPVAALLRAMPPHRGQLCAYILRLQLAALAAADVLRAATTVVLHAPKGAVASSGSTL